MLYRTGLFLLALALFLAPAQGQDDPKKAEPETLKLWNGRAPIGNGKFEQAAMASLLHGFVVGLP
ncbi:MAG: hypothetical protein K2R98_00650 [Gemmataceae bacterium]|nr:hypothetical protein [Gemmataceae bacterium]